MPKIIRITEKENKKTPYVYQYKCICSKKVELHLNEKPEKLIKCFKCL